MPELATIGVYGFDREGFLAALRTAAVHSLLDVRQRRGVRGPQYAWANSRRLQAALSEAGIAYEHHRELAPTTELRQLQYREDDRLGVGKRSRSELAPSMFGAIARRSSARPISRRLPNRCPRRGPVPCSALSAIPKPVTAH